MGINDWARNWDDLSDDDIERILRDTHTNPLTDEDIERAIQDIPPIPPEEMVDINRRAMNAMHHAQNRRDVQKWIDEALNTK